MSIATQALSAMEKRLPKVLNARTHGLIDYGHATFFLSMALLWRKSNPRAASAALLTGTFVLVQSLLTDYPLGAVPVIPFEAHGAMDGGFAALSPMLPHLLDFEGTGPATIFRANAFVEAVVVGLTDFNSNRAGREATGS